MSDSTEWEMPRGHGQDQPALPSPRVLLPAVALTAGVFGIVLSLLTAPSAAVFAVSLVSLGPVVLLRLLRGWL